jgi:hypothetical protein
MGFVGAARLGAIVAAGQLEIACEHRIVEGTGDDP